MPISQIWKGIRILHAALLASLAIYGVVVVIVAQQPSTTPITVEPGVIVPIFGGLAAAILLVVEPLLRRPLMPPRVAFPGREPDLDAVAEGAVLAALTKLRVALIVRWSLCESVGVLGLMAGFMFHDARYFAPFAVVAAGAMVASAPRAQLLDEVVRAARRT